MINDLDQIDEIIKKSKEHAKIFDEFIYRNLPQKQESMYQTSYQYFPEVNYIPMSYESRYPEISPIINGLTDIITLLTDEIFELREKE